MIEGRLINLQAAQNADWPALYAMLSDERVWPSLTSDPANVSDTGLLSLFCPQQAPGYTSASFVARDRMTGEVCGAINITGMHPVNRTGTVSLMAANPERNDKHWLCKQMVGLILQYAFTHANLHKVRAMTWNPKLGAIYKHYGAEREGVLRQETWHTGQWKDQEVWAVLAHEWRNGGRC